MKKIFLFFYVFFVSANLFAEIQISGVIKSFDGTPLQYSNIIIFDAENPFEPAAIFSADKNGNYKITISDTLLQIKIKYVAPNYSILEVPAVVLPNKNYVIDANLMPFYFSEISDEIWIIGDFNNFKETENSIQMTKLKNGIYTAKIPNPKDTLGYQILFYVADTMGYQNNDTGRHYFIEDMPHIINGQQADFYKPSEKFGNWNKTNYISYIISKEKEIQIELAPTKITSLLPATTLSSNNSYTEKYQQKNDTFRPVASIKSDNPAIEKIFQYKDAIKKLDIEKGNMSVNNLTEQEKNIYEYLLTDSISYWFANATDKELKIFLAINYVDKFWGGAKDSKLDKNIINYISNNYPLNYFWLSGNFYQLCFLESELANENLFAGKRLQHHLEEVDKTSRYYARLIAQAFYNYMWREDTTNAMAFYSVLAGSFPQEAADIEQQYDFIGNSSNNKLKIVVGNIIPDFELPNVDKSDEIFSMQKLRGKWVLIDVWHRYCGPCLSEIPNMRNVYEKYKSNNFEIYSISTDSPDVLKNFKAMPKYEMTWLHSSARGSDVVELLETVGVPHYILVAPDGKIVALDFTLRGDGLEKTLDEFLVKE